MFAHQITKNVMEFYHLPVAKVISVAKLLDVEGDIALVNVRSCLTLD